MMKSIIKMMFGLVLIVIVAGLVLPNMAIVFGTIQREGQNLTDNATYYKGISIISNFNMIFGMILIIFAIGCVVLFIAHAHKKEREEFEYYEPKNRFRY